MDAPLPFRASNRDGRAELSRSLTEHTGRTYSAAVLWLECAGRPVFQSAVGVTDPEADATKVDVDTPFDLASISKLFTATAILRLLACGRLELDDAIQRYLPTFAGPRKDQVTVRRLLTHTSGLPSMIRLYGNSAPPGDPWAAVLSSRLQATPGTTIVYSDVGFMVLGKLLEVMTGLPLRAAMTKLVLEPLHLSHVAYGPCPSAPATEYDPWRGRRIRGEVHDENAAALSGAAGHAGLFGPASEVAALARAYLHPDGSFLPAALTQEARSVQAWDATERRGLGWDVRSPEPDASEAAFSEATFGHYGFTGTAVWADPTRDLIAVLLTNRVYFGRNPEPIRTLRSQIFSTIAAAFPPDPERQE